MTSRRKYEDTHPWISFQLNLRALDWDAWSLLGEIRASVRQIASVALRPKTANALHRLYLAKGVRATTAIEGNTLSEDEVRKVLDNELSLPPSKEYLGREVRNIEQACEAIWKEAVSGAESRLNPEKIKQFNRWVRQGLPTETDDAPPGEVRTYSVGVGSYRGAPAEDCEHLLHRLCEWLADPKFAGPPSHSTEFAVIHSIIAHLYLAWIHPFADGNGRTARLVEFDILINAGFPTPCAHLLSNHYNETRTEYYRQLDYASKSKGDVGPFLRYAIQGLVDGLQAQLKEIGHEQLDIAWRNFVHEHFGNAKTPARLRQRKLILELSRQRRYVDFSELAELSPKIAAEYSRKTPKTLRRDVNALERDGLLLKEDGKYFPNRFLILAFKPANKDVGLGRITDDELDFLFPVRRAGEDQSGEAMDDLISPDGLGTIGSPNEAQQTFGFLSPKED
jgi:Fic family protein